ncbi:MAG: hypothetical protein F4Z24_04910 [Nitrospira sp. SB0666_bin_27]|nr:hypothetical protein [Nitrospira sp. SB0666_bin_27]MYF25345.1 hypothetical protein [Nitrospira sp. SB0678_bin_10]
MRRLSVVHKACGVLLIVSLTITGCLGSRDWDYPPPPENTYLEITADQKVDGSLVVVPLDDKRGTEVREQYWASVIPFVPYASSTYDRPETIASPAPVDKVSFSPSRDFARALAEEIRKTNIFTSVTFVDKDQPLPPSDFVLRGRLYSTRWERNISTYGLGPAGTVLWLAGLPLGTTETDVEMFAQIARAGEPDNVLWGFAMEFEAKETDSLYRGLEDSVTNYPRGLQEGLRLAIEDLVEKAPTRLKP